MKKKSREEMRTVFGLNPCSKRQVLSRCLRMMSEDLVLVVSGACLSLRSFFAQPFKANIESYKYVRTAFKVNSLTVMCNVLPLPPLGPPFGMPSLPLFA